MKQSLPEVLSPLEIVFQVKDKGSKRLQLRSNIDAIQIFRSIIGKDEIALRETVAMLCLNNQLQVIGWFKVSIGGNAHAIVDLKAMAACALSVMAGRVILCHNHPSGNSKPSISDNKLTKKVQQGLALLDITLIDHVIITNNGFYSYALKGKL